MYCHVAESIIICFVAIISSFNWGSSDRVYSSYSCYTLHDGVHSRHICKDQLFEKEMGHGKKNIIVWGPKTIYVLLLS